MKKPVIGITPSHNTDNDEISVRPTYLRAIEAAGGLSILLPLEVSAEDLKQLSGLCDGFLFSGGPDIHPFLLREETHMHCGNVSVARDTMELSLLKLAMEAKKPVLGICRGAQVINVGLGGDIYQDITSQAETGFPIAHKQPYSCCLPSHHVDVQRDTLLCGIADGKTGRTQDCPLPHCQRPCARRHHRGPGDAGLSLSSGPSVASGVYVEDRYCVRQYI